MNDMLDHEIIAALADILDEAPASATRPPLIAFAEQPGRTEPGQAGELPVPPQQDRRPLGWLQLVAVSVLALVLSGVVLAQRRNGPDVPSSGGSTPASVSTSVSALADATNGSSVVSTPPSLAQRLSAYSGWYLPTALPEGYEVTRINAAPSKAPPETVEQRWIRADGASTPAGALSLLSFPIAPVDDLRPPRYNATVHGIDALVFDSGEGIVVTWQEGGRQLQVRGLGLSQPATLAAAETVTVNPATGRLSMNPGEGFSLVPAPASVPNGVSLGVDLLPADGRAAGAISFSSSPNADGETLQTIKQRVDEQPGGATSSIESIAGIDRLVVRRPGGIPQMAFEITWMQDGFILSLIGGAPLDQVVAVAASVKAVDPQQLLAEGERITQRLLTRPTLDTTTFADGTRVTLKTVGDRVAGLCIEAPVVECRWRLGDAPVSASRPTAAFAAFVVDGRTLLIGWRNGPEQPSLEATGDARAPHGDVSTATITDTKTTEQGHFVEIVVPAGEQSPPVFYGGQGGAVIITESEQLLLR